MAIPNKTILIVEDEPVPTDSIKFTLDRDGFDVVCASDGEQGLVLYHEIEPALVLLDLGLPGMDGFEFLDRIALKPEDPSAVIVVTGQGDTPEFRRALDKGVTAFMKKPFDVLELRVLVRNTVALKQAQRAFKEMETERKLAETNLREAHDCLEHRVEVRTAELAHTNQRLTDEIEQRKSAEVALAASEFAYRSLIESVNALPWRMDLTTERLSYVGEQAKRILGFGVDSWTDMGAWAKRIHPEDRESALALCQESTQRGEDHVLEYRALTSEGRMIWIRDFISVVMGADGPAELVGFMIDVTMEKQTERALRESEGRLDLALRGADLGFWDHDLQTGEVLGNKRSAEIFSCSLDESILTTDIWGVSIHPEDRHDVLTQRDRHLRGETALFEAGYRFLNGSGQYKWLLTRGRVVEFDEAGSPVRMTGIVQDISERRRGELDRARLEEQLRAAQKMEALGLLAGGIAHDFNSILATVTGYTELARESLSERGQVWHDLGQALKACDRGRILVKQVLAFSRGGKIEKTSLCINKIVKEAFEEILPEIPPGIEVHKRFDLPSGTLQTNAVQIHQLLMSLCNNAVHAMGETGRLEIGLTKAEIAADTVPGSELDPALS